VSTKKAAATAPIDTDPYPPLSDYALIGDCHTAALVSKSGSIDWCCMPRFDSATVFGRLLDWERGGYFQIAPADDASSFRTYVDSTLVLVTTFVCRTGEARVYDCFTMRQGGRRNPRRQLLRIVEGTRGTVDFELVLSPRFDYAEVRPWLRHHGDRFFSAVGGNDALVFAADAELVPAADHDLESSFTIRSGTRARFSLTWMPPEDIDPAPDAPPTPEELDQRLDETTEWWQRWVAKASGAKDASGRRSAIVLKALTHAPTGAVVAAVTTSLPEDVGGSRNWDYRFTWIRDSQFTVRSLGEVGCDAEADGFRRFVERSAAGSAASLQIMYGVGGERRLPELILDLEGYARSTPVRIGNAAARQTQLDVYGYLLDLAWRWHHRGQSPDDDYWRFLTSLVDAAAEKWQQPDRGIWEIRGEPQHFVHSKAMCWTALDRGIRLAEACLRQAPVKRWTKTREEIRDAIDTEGYEQARGVYVRSFGSKDLDAALLLLPAFGYVAYDDERMVRTADAIRTELDDQGLLRRYTSHDGLEGHEGVFIACTFWLAEVLAHQGRLPDAQEAFDRAVATANDVGLFSEEYDPVHRRLLGNMPQGLSHLSHLAASVALDRGPDQLATQHPPIG
jgi:GH15 family glucan-1,4-alpha-glucosidase